MLTGWGRSLSLRKMFSWSGWMSRKRREDGLLAASIRNGGEKAQGY